MQYNLTLKKMRTEYKTPVQYYLETDSKVICMNDFIGKQWTFHFSNQINCVHCDRRIAKTFHQGYCFPCFRSLAECDSCLMSPEKCHYHLGTCRDNTWGETHCFQPHIVYLANSSGLKIGITRISHVPYRFIDQGAIQALPIYQVQNRLQSGLLEVAFKQYINDKTNWQKMLKGQVESVDLPSKRDELLLTFQQAIDSIQLDQKDQAFEYLSNQAVFQFEYPGKYQLEKITTLNLDKTPMFTGLLLGIKAQYLIFDCGVINVRKFSGYNVEVEIL